MKRTIAVSAALLTPALLAGTALAQVSSPDASVDAGVDAGAVSSAPVNFYEGTSSSAAVAGEADAGAVDGTASSRGLPTALPDTGGGWGAR